MNGIVGSKVQALLWRNLRTKVGREMTQARRLASVSGRAWKEDSSRGTQAGADIPENLDVRQRRIIYRSKQRGWLELDILFGGWAVKHVPNMKDEASIAQVEMLLDAETPHVLKWILKQEPTPPQFDNRIIHSLQAYASGEGHVNER